MFRRKGYEPERFGTLDVRKHGWQRYTHLTGEAADTFWRRARSPRRAFLYAFFFGMFGLHRFYIGHYRVALAIFALGVATLLIPSRALFWFAAVVYLIELGHIVRTTEQGNDSLEGALMLEQITSPVTPSETTP